MDAFRVMYAVFENQEYKPVQIIQSAGWCIKRRVFLLPVQYCCTVQVSSFILNENQFSHTSTQKCFITRGKAKSNMPDEVALFQNQPTVQLELQSETYFATFGPFGR